MRNRGILCVALLIVAAPVTAQSVGDGIDAWQKGDFAAAVKIWRPLAEAGDPDAAFNIGQAYRLGRGVPISLAAAQTWLLRAATKDHLDAQSTLGLLLFDSGNRLGGLRWLKTAAEKGDARALLVFGTALFNGDGVPRDPVLAYAYVSRAAAQGLAPAKATLADMDLMIPIEQRKKGVAMARAMATAPVPDPAPKPLPVKARTVAAQKPPAVKAQTVVSLKTVAATPQAAVSGNWRVQLGAFSQRASAEALFRKLSGAGPLAGRKPFLIPVGPMTRLQAGPFETKAAAAAACSTLSARGQACFPVAAK
ncbi:MAG: SPOR domain-containing protein [Sphingomicrobium sp.]